MPAVTFTARATDPLGQYGERTALGDVVQPTSVLKLMNPVWLDTVVRPDSILQQMDMLIVQYQPLRNDPGLVSRLKAANPNLKVLLYMFPQTPLTGFSQFVTNEVRDTIRNRGWLLRNPAGGADTRVRHPYGGVELLCADMGNSDFRAYFIDNLMRTWIIPYNLDGFMNDGPAYSDGFQGIGPWTVSPTAEQYALYRGDNPSTPNAIFLSELKAALGPNRILIMNTPQQWRRSANYVDTIPVYLSPSGRLDGLLLEAAFTGINNESKFTVSETDQIDHHLTTIDRTLALGRVSFCHGRSVNNTTEEEMFQWLFHCYLLQANGNHYLSYWPAGRPWSQARIDFMRNTCNALGAPLGPYQTEAGTTKILRRVFQGGYVRVNKSAALIEGSPSLGPRAHQIVLT